MKSTAIVEWIFGRAVSCRPIGRVYRLVIGPHLLSQARRQAMPLTTAGPATRAC